MGSSRRLRFGAVLQPRNYRALWGMLRTSVAPVATLARYTGSSGEYPWTTAVRTPIGRVPVHLPHAHDVRTLNEIFFRHDYGHAAPAVVVDVGANIGLASLFFLTRRPDSRVHAWEPVDSNLETLRQNIAPYSDRCELHATALAPTAGEAEFLVEPVGRYSGLAAYQRRRTGVSSIVNCEAIADALRMVIAREGRIDVVKIDTEGSEEALVDAIPFDLWADIGSVVYERAGDVVRAAAPMRRPA